MSKTKIALVQLVSSKHVDKNLERVSELVERAAESQPAAIFLPENFPALGADDPYLVGANEAGPDGEVRGMMSSLARETGCWIFAGTMPTVTRPDGKAVPGKRVRAASFVYDDTGSEVARYDKIHMFDVDVADSHRNYRESATFEPGEDVVQVDTPFGCVGLTVCYDIRFPEIYRLHFGAGATMLTIPSAFTVPTGEAHFRTLMQARAVENSAFTIAACQGGEHDSGRVTWGHSMVVGPWGDVLGELDTGEGILEVALDFDRLEEIRQEMPFLAQRRL